MRSSRSTEIYNQFGMFLENKWIGHSSKVARDNYFQVLETDIEKAVNGGYQVPEQASEDDFAQAIGIDQRIAAQVAFESAGDWTPEEPTNRPANLNPEMADVWESLMRRAKLTS